MLHTVKWTVIHQGKGRKSENKAVDVSKVRDSLALWRMRKNVMGSTN